MRTHWHVLARLSLALWIVASPLSSLSHPLQGEEEIRADEWYQTTLADFGEGAFDNVQLLDYGDGALSLAVKEETCASLGVYTSIVKLADFDFNAIGVQWRALLPLNTGLRVSVRVSTDGTAWSLWQEVPEPEQEDEYYYALTPLIVGRERYIQYRLTLTTQDPNLSPRLQDITLTYIDSTRGPSLEDVESLPVRLALQGAGVPQPSIISRAGWGANESYRFDAEEHEIWPTEYQTPRKTVIHHTVTKNNDPNPPATVRAIYYYHAISLGWGDIGYNYLVDWHGNMYEGRYGGLDVVGGHVYGYNHGSLGIGAIGSYGNTADSVPPGAELLASLVDLSAWQCSRSLINPNESCFFIDKVTQNIAGHRDYNATACPGDYLYAELPLIRTQIWDKILDYVPSYSADFLSHDTPQAMLPGQAYILSVTLRNAGTLTWLAQGQNPVKLGYRWHDDQGGEIPGDIQTSLPHDVSYGHTVELDNVSLEAPAQPGQYILEWDLLHEGVTWFSAEGSRTLTVPVTVLDPKSLHRTYLPLVMNDYSASKALAEEARALWVPRWSYSTRADVETIVHKAAAANFNILLFQVRGQSDAYYQSQYEPWADRLSGTLGQDPGWDPLAVAIEEAHAAGLQLHAYANIYHVWLGTSPPPADSVPQHMYHRFNDLYGNEWVQWHEDGTPMELNSSYLLASPAHPAVTDHIVAVCRDIVQDYDIDGLHLDYIRYSSPYHSHDPVSEQRFQEAQPINWADWQRAQITELVRRLYDEVVPLRPDTVMSVAAWPVYKDKWGWVTYGDVKYDGYDGYYQDSRGWLQLGKMDFLAPMLYGTSVQNYLDRFEILVQDFVAESYGRHIYAGIHASYNSFSEIETRIQVARQAEAQGQAIFAYSLVEERDYWDDFRSGPYAQSAQIPSMPWKIPVTPTPVTRELVINGGFEGDAAWQIPATAHRARYSTLQAHSGLRSMRTGVVNSPNNTYSYSSAWQAVSLPPDTTAATLRFWEYPVSQETGAQGMKTLMAFAGDPRLMGLSDDAQYVLVLDAEGTWLATLLWQRSNAQTWTEHTHDLSPYAAQTIRLQFGTFNNGHDGVTSMFVDDVSLQVTYVP